MRPLRRIPDHIALFLLRDAATLKSMAPRAQKNNGTLTKASLVHPDGAAGTTAPDVIVRRAFVAFMRNREYGIQTSGMCPTCRHGALYQIFSREEHSD